MVKKNYEIASKAMVEAIDLPIVGKTSFGLIKITKLLTIQHQLLAKPGCTGKKVGLVRIPILFFD